MSLGNFLRGFWLPEVRRLTRSGLKITFNQVTRET